MLDVFLQDPVLKEAFPCMYDLALLSRLIPTSNASVERSFSLMNQLCTVNRNRLDQDKLSALMLICREGPQVLSADQRKNIRENFKKMKQREIAL